MKLARLKKIVMLAIKMSILLLLGFFFGALMAEIYDRWLDFCFISYYQTSEHLYTFFSLLPFIAFVIVICIVIAYIKVRYEEENDKES